METKFFVVEAYRYKASGNWEWKLSGEKDDYDAAKQFYHDRCSAVMKESNDFAMVIWFDSFGNKILSDFIDRTTPEEPKTIVSVEADGNTYTITYSDGTVEVFEKTAQLEETYEGGLTNE